MSGRRPCGSGTAGRDRRCCSCTGIRQVGAALSWELDLWGRLRRLTESARAQYLATEEARRGVVVSLVADVAANYFTLRERDRELEIARGTRDLASRNLELVHLRHDHGAATGLDVHQAEQLFFIATAQIASTQRDIDRSEERRVGKECRSRRAPDD